MLDELFAHRLDLSADAAGDLRGRLPTHGGVYVLSDESDRPVQLAACESLRRVLWGRLDPERPAEEGPRADLRPVVRRIRYEPTFSQFETALTFHRIARRLHPDDYMDLCSFSPVWFARVGPDERLPRFVPVTRVDPDPARVTIGPFPTRIACARFIEQIEDLFDLCREYHILEQTPDGQACAYADMGRCPAPCDGSIPLDAYRRTVADAARFAAGQREAVVAGWTGQMQAAADARDYETAARFKTRLDRAGKPTGGDACLVDDMRRFDYLIIQRGGGRSKIKPFYVHGGTVAVGEAVALRKIDDAVEMWRETATHPATEEEPDAVLHTERIWLVAHFLFKRDRAPGLFLRTDRLPTADELAERIRSRFGALSGANIGTHRVAARSEPRPSGSGHSGS